MKALGDLVRVITPAVAVEPPTPSVPSLRPAGRPPLLDKAADYDIPARLWSNWKPEFGLRAIVRALAAEERAALQRRSYAIECGLLAYAPTDIDTVDCAIDAMFAGYRALRYPGEASEATTEVTRAVLREFPAWAIELGCLRIARREAVLNPPLDPRWPPNDVQIHEVVAGVVAPYRKALASAQALLAAPVEPPQPSRPTREEIEAKLGRPLPDRAHVSGLPPPPPGDGKHMQRVLADIEARKRRHDHDTA